MAEGSTFKRCTCRDPGGKQIGGTCPKLRRRGGRWSTAHGTWYYQLELPPKADGKRRPPLRRGGFTSQTDAEQELGKARELLAIATDLHTKLAIADLIVSTVRTKRVLPDAQTVRRKIRTHQELHRTILLGEWLTEFLTRKRALADNTLRSYHSHIQLYLTPYLGHIPVDKLRVTDIADLFDAIEETNDIIRQARTTRDPALRDKVKGRRVVGPTSMHRIRATLRHALNMAIKQDRLIDFNPAAVVELPPADKPRPLVWTPERVRNWTTDHQQHLDAERQRRAGLRVNVIDAYISTPRPSAVMVWTPDQTSTFLTYARRHELFALYRLIALRGLRRGEACGLRTQDLDLDTGTAAIKWQITQLGWQTSQSTPKTEASDRTIALDADTITALRRHRRQTAEQRLAAGRQWADSGLVFTTPTGAPLHPAWVTDQFHWLCYQAGLPPIRLHDLRHGAASLMLAAGVELKIVQETLGHTSSAFTRDTYITVYPHVAAAAAESTAALLPHPATPVIPTKRP